MHEYQLTPHSLYAAVSVGLESDTIISVLNRLSKTDLPDEVKMFVRESTQNYGKVGGRVVLALVLMVACLPGGTALVVLGSSAGACAAAGASMLQAGAPHLSHPPQPPTQPIVALAWQQPPCPALPC